MNPSLVYIKCPVIDYIEADTINSNVSIYTGTLPLQPKKHDLHKSVSSICLWLSAALLERYCAIFMSLCCWITKHCLFQFIQHLFLLV